MITFHQNFVGLSQAHRKDEESVTKSPPKAHHDYFAVRPPLPLYLIHHLQLSSVCIYLAPQDQKHLQFLGPSFSSLAEHKRQFFIHLKISKVGFGIFFVVVNLCCNHDLAKFTRQIKIWKKRENLKKLEWWRKFQDLQALIYCKYK